MRNLPKLTSLTTVSDSYYYSCTFRDPRHIILENMPSLTNVYLPVAFQYKNDVTIRGNIGALRNYFN